MSPILTFKDVSLKATVGQGLILSDISLAIEPGEFIALLGPSGAGKTSVLRLMNRLTEASSGSIAFHGSPIQALAAVKLRQQIMLVGQDCRMLGMTGRSALDYPLQLQQIPAQQRAARVQTWIERLQLPQDWLNRSELELSGGQQQQIAIARALISEPTILLLDEPTSAQDLGSANRILAAIKAQTRKQGLAVVMSNHQLELAEQVCDRVLYLEQGRLRRDEPAAQVDWQSLRQALVQADAVSREDWGED